MNKNKELIEMRFNRLKKRYDKVLIALKGVTLDSFLNREEVRETKVEAPSKPIVYGDYSIQPWETALRTEPYKDVSEVVSIISRDLKIGTCKNALYINSPTRPKVSKGNKGVIVDKKCSSLLPGFLKENLHKVSENTIWVIFNSHLFFIDPKRLTDIKYDMQMKLF